MKSNKKQLIIVLLSILICIVAFTFCILDFTGSVVIWGYLWHPILTFFLIVCVGFGVICFVLGVLDKLPWFYFLASVLLGLSVVGILIHYVPWWICLIAIVVVWIITALICLVSAGNHTESIALNDKPDYKNYKERRAEKLEAEDKDEDIPEIKSFK